MAFVGANPEAGEIMPETGGVRKIRWAREGMGKRGGTRVIYYYRSERLPVFLLTAYPKDRKANLSKAERNAMKRLAPILVAGYPEEEDAYENSVETEGEKGGATPTEEPDRGAEHHRGTRAGDRVDAR